MAGVGGCVGSGENSEAYVCGVDVSDAFYNFKVPSLASWLCIDEVFTDEWLGVTEVYDEESQSMVPVSPDTELFLSAEAMSMGWSLGSLLLPGGYLPAGCVLRWWSV